MRGRVFALKHWIILVSLLVSMILLVHLTNGINFLKMNTDEFKTSKNLNYVLWQPRAPITLDLYEAERYEAAVIVQQLIGNLVYYSNFGRYEPRLAKKWQRVSPQIWSFEMHTNLFCENGEPITPESLKRSIMKSIRFMNKSGEVPVLSRLVGFKEFLDGNSSLPGISSHGNFIDFEFTRPMRDGVLQILSFAQFGYICSENRMALGSILAN